MNLAFEITQEDLEIVLNQNEVSLSESKIEKLFENTIMPEVDRIEKAALDAEVTDSDEDTLNNQTNAAHAEIRKILEEEGTLP